MFLKVHLFKDDIPLIENEPSKDEDLVEEDAPVTE